MTIQSVGGVVRLMKCRFKSVERDRARAFPELTRLIGDLSDRSWREGADGLSCVCVLDGAQACCVFRSSAKSNDNNNQSRRENDFDLFFRLFFFFLVE